MNIPDLCKRSQKTLMRNNRYYSDFLNLKTHIS